MGFKVTSWFSLHAAYTEAFRAPDLTELFVSGTHFTCGPGCANLFVPNPNLKPEKAHNKEISARFRRDDLFMPGDQGRFRATYFRNDVDDFIDSIVIFFAPADARQSGTRRHHHQPECARCRTGRL
ncbi:MAG: TonB-dependent receptor [Synechococcaceae cyanobacterium SM1_2_3]|nr:TonB-dependent receptor [Synechococcaceae cyanobacterium SM1_2_3]